MAEGKRACKVSGCTRKNIEYGRRLCSLPPETRIADDLTIAELQRQVRGLREAKGFDIILEQRLAYLMSETGEVAREVLKLSRDGNGDVGEMSEWELRSVREKLGMEIYDVVWNLLDLADLAGVRPEELEEAFRRKARLNEDRKW